MGSAGVMGGGQQGVTGGGQRRYNGRRPVWCNRRQRALGNEFVRLPECIGMRQQVHLVVGVSTHKYVL